MKRSEYLLLITLVIAGTLLLFWVVPATHFIIVGLGKIVAFIWMILAGLIVGILTLGLPGFIGFLSKAFLIAAIDANRQPNEAMVDWMHWGIAAIGGLAIGLLHAAVFMPYLMGFETWVRWIALDFGWIGVYETPSMFWFFWGLAWFAVIYLTTSYVIKVPRRRRAEEE